LFALGALGPAIKRDAMQNVPWTKAWRMMFLCAFVAFESLAFLRKRGAGGHVETPGLEDTIPIWTQRAAQLKVHTQLINTLERSVLFSAILLHVLILIWATVDLC
jgi:hypothetical protein